MTETPAEDVSRRRVVVVDDEQVIANTLAIILNNAGFEARRAFSGEEAVELLETFSPDVLIVDVIMPGITGIEVAIIVRDKLPECKILLFSGQAATSATSWMRPGREGTNLKSWLSPHTLLTFSSDCANKRLPTVILVNEVLLNNWH